MDGPALLLRQGVPCARGCPLTPLAAATSQRPTDSADEKGLLALRWRCFGSSQSETDVRSRPPPPAPAASCCSPARELGQRRLVPCRRVPTPTRDWTGRGSGPEAFGDAVRSVHPPTLDCFHTPVSSAIERRGEGKGEPCQQWTGLFFTLLSFYFSLWQEKVS